MPQWRLEKMNLNLGHYPQPTSVVMSVRPRYILLSIRRLGLGSKGLSTKRTSILSLHSGMFPLKFHWTFFADCLDIFLTRRPSLRSIRHLSRTDITSQNIYVTFQKILRTSPFFENYRCTTGTALLFQSVRSICTMPPLSRAAAN
jgi:hypothetical protein